MWKWVEGLKAQSSGAVSVRFCQTPWDITNPLSTILFSAQGGPRPFRELKIKTSNTL